MTSYCNVFLRFYKPARLGLFAALILGFSQTAGAAEGVQKLRSFLSSVTHFSADFQQIVYSQNKQVQNRSSGQVYLSRPGQFRWNVTAPYKQEIVSNGNKVWVYDPDLAQVVVRAAGTALSSAPIFLLSGGRDVSEGFVLRDLGRQNGYDWVEMTPRTNGSEFERVSIGFNGNLPTVMDLRDSLGNSTQVQFQRIKTGVAINRGLYNFRAPAGVDVVGG